MSKLLKYSLIIIVLIGVFVLIAYLRGLSMSEEERTNAVNRAKSVDFEIVKENINNNTGEFIIYYPEEKPTAQDMKDLTAYIVCEKSKGLSYVAVTVYDDMNSAENMANPSDPSLSGETLRNNAKLAFGHLIVIWDSLDFEASTGENYKYLDGLDLKL